MASDRGIRGKLLPTPGLRTKRGGGGGEGGLLDGTCGRGRVHPEPQKLNIIN